MPTFRNTKTGRVVEVPDDPPTRVGRRGRDKQWAQKLARMSRSKRWDRFDGDAKPAKKAAAKKAAAKKAAAKKAAAKKAAPPSAAEQSSEDG